MSRINTNVPSIVAQNYLGRTQTDLQTRLARLSSGLRINVGKDDPAGLIASEALRSDIIGVEKAITNSERANQVIATADSALGQVSSLLNDIRGLVTEAANSGALSEDQLAANQLQIDSSLEAIDRIAQVTSFQGRRLLDGSLDFLTKNVGSDIQALQIDQANFGTLSQIDIEVNVAAQATKGQLNYAFDSISSAVTLQVSGKSGSEAFTFAANSTTAQIASAVNLVSDATGVKAEVLDRAAQAGSVTLSSFGADNDIVLTAATAGEAVGNYRVKYSSSPGDALGVTYTEPQGADAGTINITLETQDHVAAVYESNPAGPVNGLQITAALTGTELNGVSFDVNDTGTLGVSYDHSTKTFAIDIDEGVTTADDIVNAINSDAVLAELFSASLLPDSDGVTTVVAANLEAGFSQTVQGVDGGAILSTANDVIAELNATAGLSDLVVASLATDNDGHEAVTASQEYANYGTTLANNALQFLGPDGARNVRFTSVAGQTLGLDVSTDPVVEDFSKFVLQGDSANSSIIISAKAKGAEYDGVSVVLEDDAAGDRVVYDINNKTLTFKVDLTGGAVDGDVLRDLVNNDSYVSKFFSADRLGISDGTGLYAAGEAGTLGTTSGGQTSDGTVIINLATDANGQVTTTAQDLVDFFNDPSQFLSGAALSSAQTALADLKISVTNAHGSDGTGKLAATTTDLAFATQGRTFTDSSAAGTTYAVNGENARLTFSALNAGAAYDGVEIEFEDTATQGNETFSYDAVTKKLTIGVESGVSTADDVVAAFAALDSEDTVRTLFEVEAEGTGAGEVTISDYAVLAGGVTEGGTEDGVSFVGNKDAGEGGLRFTSTEYGSEAFVQVKALSGAFALTDAAGAASERGVGTDVNLSLNGVGAVGKGLKASINTASLDLNFSLSETATAGTTLSFSITGGGAKFQLGPDVVSNQQARLGIQSVSTATLGGVAGRLYELRSGGDKSLANDVHGAARVVEEVLGKVTSLRGRLGAFQKTTLETNIYTLNDTLANLTDAESAIRDADFAKESAKLTRAQILVQSGTTVLSIANSNPQNVLGLLRG